MDKPLTIKRKEFVHNLETLINQSGLPLFAVEDTLTGILPQIHAAAQMQEEQDEKEYARSLEENQKESEEET